MKSLVRPLPILIGLLSFSFSGCDSGDKEEVIEPIKVSFNLTGAKAILLSENGTSGRVKEGESYAFKIDDAGNITPIIEGAKVVFAKPVSGAVYIVIDDPAKENLRNFYVKLDNTIHEIEDNVGTLMGENKNGDLIFNDVSIFRKATLTVEKLQTTLTNPTVQYLSGDLAIITDNSVFQIFNTVTKVRYNVAGCNGPRMISFAGSEKALVDDCSNQLLIDMSDGTRSAVDISSFNHEAVQFGDAVVVLSQGLGMSSGYQLGLIDHLGNLELLSDYEFTPGSSACMNCSAANLVLFSSENNLVVKELNKVTVLTVPETTPQEILSGYNVTSVSVSGDLVYYVAENNVGEPVTGIYNLSSKSNQILSSESSFDQVIAIN